MEITEALYHRPPYLLIEKIISCDEQRIVCETHLKGDEFFFKGHFPNAPVLPGALMQEMTTQTAGVLIAKFHNPLGKEHDTENFDPERPALGVLNRVRDAKYKSFVKPGETLRIEANLIEKLDNYFEFTGKVTSLIEGGEKLIMKNRFLLSNVPSSNLM